MSSDTVKVFEHTTSGGYVVAQAELDSQPTLNALSLEMIELLVPPLARWARDPKVAAVVITGAGERAFCAGGDIQALYRAMQANHQAGERVDDYPYEFFEREYRLDYRLQTYPKPVVVLGHGVIMGGGLGIFNAADHRVVTENVRIALPEVTIGLFPDAGGTWMLKHMPEHHALFVGMTGSNLNAADALAAGLGTHAVARSDLARILPGLLELPLAGDPATDGRLIDEWLDGITPPSLPAPELPAVADTLHADGGFAVAAQAVRAMAGRSEWVDRGIATMERGCPTTVGIVVEQVRRAHSLDLADCFRMEMTVATHCADNHDFSEGVRALLIEKDNAPAWQFGDLDALPEGYVLDHFVEPWPRNPLYDLEEST